MLSNDIGQEFIISINDSKCFFKKKPNNFYSDLNVLCFENVSGHMNHQNSLQIFSHGLHNNVVALIKIVRIHFHGRYILPAFADPIEIHKIKHLNRDIVRGTKYKLLMKHCIMISRS